jgi:hypothetical protein
LLIAIKTASTTTNFSKGDFDRNLPVSRGCWGMKEQRDRTISVLHCSGVTMLHNRTVRFGMNIRQVVGGSQAFC